MVLFFAKAVDIDLLEYLEQALGMTMHAHGEPAAAADDSETLYFFTNSNQETASRATLLSLLQEYFTFAAMASDLLGDISDNMFTENDTQMPPF